ncbi:MAG: transposase, partial [Pseudobdellovibrionaceae bacterium]
MEVRNYESVTIRIGCNMHGRRYFEKAHTIGAKSVKSLAEKGLKFYQSLYEDEDKIRDKTPQERKKHRDEIQKPIWDEFKTWVQTEKENVPPKSKICEAFNYFENEYEYLTGYLKDGLIEMDNGFTERKIRKFAIGRNNWMFSDTEAGAHPSALLYSICLTAHTNEVNVYKLLVHLIKEIPKA